MKNRIKKVLVSIQIFFLSMISKVFALSVYDIQTDYGIQTAYGIEIGSSPIVSPIEKAFSIGRIVLPVILFVIGLFVVISKKIAEQNYLFMTKYVL